MVRFLNRPVRLSSAQKRRWCRPRADSGLALITAMLVVAMAPAALAGSRTSANYGIAADTADSGGQRATSASYTNDGSVGNVAGLSTVAAPVETAKSGYVGQLYEVTSLVISAPQNTVATGATLALAALQVLDDASTVNVNAASVTWSVLSGPIASISASGLATAGVVSQDTAAAVQGAFAGLTGTLNLTVTFTAAANFASWQQGVFTSGELSDASVSGPHAVYGVDGYTNLVKYALGLDPKQNTVIGLPVISTDGTDWIYTSTRPSGTTDIGYAVEVSTDLVNWTSSGVTHELVSSGGGVETWRGRYPVGSTTKIYMRLQVTLP